MALISVATQTSDGTFAYTDMNQIIDALKSAGYDVNFASIQINGVALASSDLSDGSALLKNINNENIDDLSDVTITAVADNEVLAYNSATSTWINQTASEAGLLTALADDSTPTLSGTLDASSQDIINIELAEFEQEVDNGNSSTADTVDWGAGNNQKSTLTDNCTFTFTAPSGPARLQLKLIQDGTGSRTVTWPAAVKWSGGTAPTLSTAAASVDIVTFWYDGTNYYGVEVLDLQ